jgi:hypothetical protein
MQSFRALGFAVAIVLATVLTTACSQVAGVPQASTASAARSAPEALPGCYPNCFRYTWRLVNFTGAPLTWRRIGSNCISLPMPPGPLHPGWHPIEFHFAAKTGGVCNHQTRWYTLRFTLADGAERDFHYHFYEKDSQTGAYTGWWQTYNGGHTGRDFIFCFYNANPGYYLARPWAKCS